MKVPTVATGNVHVHCRARAPLQDVFVAIANNATLDETEPVIDEGNGSFVFSAKVNIDEVRERLDVHIEPEGFETVGGYVLTRVGRVPAVGETFEFDGLMVQVLEAERRRIHKVRFRRAEVETVSAGR